MCQLHGCKSKKYDLFIILLMVVNIIEHFAD